MSPQGEKGKKKSSAKSSRDLKKDEVGRSGVYPMSGPHPAGDAPLRGQMAWGQGERGAPGYEDHGSSELYLDSGVLVGGLDKNHVATDTFAAESSGETIREIAVAEWPAFCEWFSKNFRAMEVSMERRQGNEQIVECRNRPLEAITAQITANGVGEISVSVDASPGKKVVNIPGPTKMRMSRNAAGWPTQLAINSRSIQVVLRFTGEARSLPAFSKNSWGE
ncbi:MAG: hypothetical protein ACYC46_04345 [Acidobacteriaceae bacterium]